MEAVTAMTYKTSLSVAGQYLHCVESYESVLERMLAAEIKAHDGDTAGEGTFKAPPPIELTIAGADGRPVRAAIAVSMIGFVVDIPEDQREEVAES